MGLTVIGALSLWMLVGAGQMAGAQQEVYVNTFEDATDPLSEWSRPATDTTPVGARRFLGQFGSETVRLTLTDLPPHANVSVAFDLLLIQSWDGNSLSIGEGPDVWELSVEGGPTLLRTTFSNVDYNRQSYPDPYPGGDHPARTGAVESDTLGYTYYGDSVYRLRFTFLHSANSLVLNFSGIVLEGISNESWGLDNVRVRVAGTPILVTTAQDSGPGSLRQAIFATNASEESPSAIGFNIPRTDSGFDGHVFTIQPTTPLPAARRPTFIDGTTQTAWSGDSNPLGPEVVLNGGRVDRGHGLVLRGERSAVSGLVINGFAHGAGIRLQTSPRGAHPPSQHRLLNNYIGTDPTGTTAVPNASGVSIHGRNAPVMQARDNTLEGNLIAGNLGVGISLCEAAETRITGNRIGTDHTGTAPLGNGSHGVHLHCAGAPNTLIEQNTIAFNAGDGIRLAPDYRSAVALTPAGHQGTAIRSNAIWANAGLGMNMLPPPFGTEDGSTPNDVCDADVGANRLQNFPALTLTTSDGRSTRISGILNSLPHQVFEIDLFANVSVDPTGFGEGEFFLGTVSVLTDAVCQGTFTAVVPLDTIDLWVTATATDAAGNTSEFSPAAAVQEITFTCQGGGQRGITGQITTADAGQGLAWIGIEVFREEDSCQEQTTTDAVGGYQVPNLGPGTYVVIPHHATCRFAPRSWRVRLDSGDAELPFTATCAE